MTEDSELPTSPPALPPDWRALLSRYTWRAIRHCPGRWVLAEPQVPLAVLSGGCAPALEARVPGARDIVVVTPLRSGGLISYQRDDGSWLHTLNTEEGFARKLAQLGFSAETW